MRQARRTHVVGISMGGYGGVVTVLDKVRREEDGQDMIEYALLAALISVVAIAVIILIGPYLKDLFEDIVNALGNS
jgi:pilus assembly protein Flp/PilA